MHKLNQTCVFMCELSAYHWSIWRHDRSHNNNVPYFIFFICLKESIKTLATPAFKFRPAADLEALNSQMTLYWNIMRKIFFASYVNGKIVTMEIVVCNFTATL